MSIVYATALPTFPPAVEEDALRQLRTRWEGAAGPRLSPAQRAHCLRFRCGGRALRARVSRLLARLLALRALPEGAILDMDAQGRPLVTGAAGWQIAFTHSGSAAFCLVCAPGESPAISCAGPALDAEAWGTPPPCDRAFAAPAPTQDAALRRWVLAEALYKALGAVPALWGDVAGTAHAGAGRRRGYWQAGSAALHWRFLPVPGHMACVALPGAQAALRLAWLSWRALS